MKESQEQQKAWTELFNEVVELIYSGQKLFSSDTYIGPMPGGGWGYSGTGIAQADEYEALNPDEATRTLLEVYQGKYHRDSYQDRVAALAKDGIFLCRKK